MAILRMLAGKYATFTLLSDAVGYFSRKAYNTELPECAQSGTYADKQMGWNGQLVLVDCVWPCLSIGRLRCALQGARYQHRLAVSDGLA